MYIKELFDMGAFSANTLAKSFNDALIIPYGVSRSSYFNIEVTPYQKNIVMVHSPNAMQRISAMYSLMRAIGNMQKTKDLLSTIVDCDSTGEGLIFQGLEGVTISAAKGNYQNLASDNLNHVVKVITERRNLCYDVDCHDYQLYNQYAKGNDLELIVPMVLFIDNVDAIFAKPELVEDMDSAVKALKFILKYAASMGVVVIMSSTVGYATGMEFIEREMSLLVQPEANGNLVKISNADLKWESEIVRLPNA